MPLAGKSNQIKEGSRSGKLIKCSKKSTLNIWLTKKPELKPQPPIPPIFAHSEAQTMRSLAFHLNLQLYLLFERAVK